MENIKEKLDAFLKEKNFSFIGEQNGKIKQVKGLISNTKPNPEKLFIAEGLWIYKKLIEFNTPVNSVIVCNEYLHTEEAFTALKTLCGKTNDVYAVSAKTYDKISERDKPDGLMAVARLPVYDIDKFTFDNKAVILVLDGIEIPGNVGTMLRMADGAGLDAVFIVNKKARLSHPKLVKGSMGAVLSVPIFEFDDVEKARQWLYKNGFNIYLADTRAEKHYYDEPFGHKTALVMGSERYGITRSWYDNEYIMISIPMLGKCDSLNVGVAATVLAYEAAVKNKFGARVR